MTDAVPTSAHRWRFFRAGGVDQVRLDRGADIVHLDELDQKLWVALSCPVKGLEFDERTLALLDLDGDGRVRVPEILAAVRWVDACLKRPDGLVEDADGLPLAEIDPSTPEGAAVLQSAKHLLEGLGRAGATTVTVDDATRTTELFAKAKRNGDGVVAPDQVDDAPAAKVAAEIVECMGAVVDRSGRPGYDAGTAKAFFDALAAFSGWWKHAEDGRRDVLPFGDATDGAAARALEAVRAKIDDWFTRCRLAAYDPRSLAAMNRKDDVYASLATKDLSATSAETAALPIALIEPSKPLPLGAGVNPAWTSAMATLAAQVVTPLFGKDSTSLTEGEWTRVAASLAPFAAWKAAKAGGAVEKLGLARVREILAGSARPKLEKAIADDLAAAPQVAAIARGREARAVLARPPQPGQQLRQLLGLLRPQARRCSRRARSILDGRSFDLCVHVTDPGKHASLAVMAKSYLAYVDCTRPSGEKMQIAAAVTAGDSDNLFVGRNGLFYDRKGRDWDATDLEDRGQPDQHRAGVLGAVQEAAALDRGAGRQARGGGRREGERAACRRARRRQARPATPIAPVAPKKLDIGVVAALGVAVGGITAALGALLGAFFGLGLWMPLGLVGALLLISGPSMLIAWLKLRRRNLGPILDANGWAVNALTRINLPLGRSLTDVAKLPPGARALARRPVRRAQAAVAESRAAPRGARRARLRPLEDGPPLEVARMGAGALDALGDRVAGGPDSPVCGLPARRRRPGEAGRGTVSRSSEVPDEPSRRPLVADPARAPARVPGRAGRRSGRGRTADLRPEPSAGARARAGPGRPHPVRPNARARRRDRGREALPRADGRLGDGVEPWGRVFVDGELTRPIVACARRALGPAGWPTRRRREGRVRDDPAALGLRRRRCATQYRDLADLKIGARRRSRRS